MNSQLDETDALIGSGPNDQAGDVMMEDQIARNIVDLLDSRAHRQSPAVIERLAEARGVAVGRLAELQAVSQQGIQRDGNVLQWFGHHRVTSAALILGAMLIAILAVQHMGMSHHVEHGDAFLLASDLPPEAYADKGFNAWVGLNEI